MIRAVVCGGIVIGNMVRAAVAMGMEKGHKV